MRTIILAATAAAVVVGAPAGAQNNLGGLFKQLTQPRTAAARTGVASGGRSAVLAAATPSQSAEVDRLLAVPLQDARIAADRQSALPVIRTLVSTAACASASEAWNARNRLMARPQTFGGYNPQFTPMQRTQYHDKGRCMDVVRIVDWSKPANNAVRFRVYFVAEDSGEAASVAFELVRSSDGEWLVRDFGMSS